MPRNVVTVRPRFLVLPTRRNREATESVLAHLGERYRPRRQDDGSLKIDFPKRLGGRAARDEVVAEMTRIAPRWRRLFVVYPTEHGLRQRHGDRRR